MNISDFIDFLEKDREFQLQVAAHKYIHPQKPRYMRLDLDERLRLALAGREVKVFYSHQVMTIDLLRQEENVVLMTPTASGKSLAYNIPVIESILEDGQSKALYLFPLKGLEQDQMRSFRELAEIVGLDNPAEVYDGDTPEHKRRLIRERLPNVVFTNPDMLHLALLPFHEQWKDFFGNLRYVVIDEIHSYRGVFGSHVAQVMRRLRRICRRYGSNPVFVAASATIANPGRLAEDLIGVPFRVVDENGGPAAGKHIFFANPIESPYSLALKIFLHALEYEVRTIVFTKARKITELIYTWALDNAPGFADRISPYRAGFLPGERREIEAALFSGKLLGVVSTSALELGVDIGGLDCCILCGYPGSVSSTWQRAGRVGRQGNESVVILVAIQDALDHYFMRHPEEFFEKSHEAAVLDPSNKNILKKHLVCAASELPLERTDDVYEKEIVGPLIDDLAAEGAVHRGRKSDVWFSSDRSPQRKVNIRTIGERFRIVSESGRTIGELSGGRVFKEAFPGAIYLHRGKQYLVTELDMPGRTARCREVKVSYYTQPLGAEKTEILSVRERRKYGNTDFYWGDLRITHKTTGYDRKRNFDRGRISTHQLDMPEYVFETEGCWTVVERSTIRDMESAGYDLAGTLHAVEHVAIACMPLFALCDRGDVGGLSHTDFPDFGLPAIFIYDGHEGGVGLTRRAVDIADDWLKAALRIIEECPCLDGCPSCVQDPQCGNRNQPLNKLGAGYWLRRFSADRV